MTKQKKLIEQNNESLTPLRIKHSAIVEQTLQKFENIRDNFKNDSIMEEFKVTEKYSKILQKLIKAMEELFSTIECLKNDVNNIYNRNNYREEMKDYIYANLLSNTVFSIADEIHTIYERNKEIHLKEYLTQNECIDIAEIYELLKQLLMYVCDLSNYIIRTSDYLESDVKIRDTYIYFTESYDSIMYYITELLDSKLYTVLSRECKIEFKDFFISILNISSYDILIR